MITDDTKRQAKSNSNTDGKDNKNYSKECQKSKQVNHDSLCNYDDKNNAKGEIQKAPPDYIFDVEVNDDGDITTGMEDANVVKSKKNSSRYLAFSSPKMCANNSSVPKAKIRKSKSDHGCSAAVDVASVNQIELNSKLPANNDRPKSGGNTSVGHSYSFNHHVQCFNRQAKKSAIGLGLANMNQQLLSATMFGVVLGGDSKASQQVNRLKFISFMVLDFLKMKTS